MFLFKLLRRAIAFLLLLVIVVPVFALGKTWYAANNPTVRNGDVIVVLGAAQLDGRPGLVLEARLTEAKRIYDLGLANKIITVGGGAPGDRTTEAAAGRIWLMQNGVKYVNIKAIDVGRDTLSSTKAYAAELRDRKIKNVIIVTDPFHCLRSMIMANDRDGAVPWYQGLELYNGMRRLGKPCWLLNYNGDDHNLMQNANRFDLSIRMRQFFDYYLQGQAAPKWLSEGIPAIEKGKMLKYELEKD